MKKLALFLICFALSQSTLMAQSLAGTWQGTLQAGRDLRIVLKISTTDADKLKAVMYSIDQGGQPTSASTVIVQGSNVKIPVPGVGGAFEGKLSADGNSIAGTWTQGPKPLPLNLTRADNETAWAIPEPPAPPKPMAATADPSFEVVTIKPSNPDTRGMGFRVQNRNFSTLNTTVVSLITFAYGIHPRQIVGAPAWMESEKFDISAKPDGEGQPNDKQWKTMVQKVLADRFRLSFHRDKKELPVYILVLTKTGSKMTKNESDPNGLPGLGFRGLGALVTRNANMTDFAGLLQSAVLDRPVLDQTGLSGRFDFTLNWTPDEFQFTGMGVKVPPPTDKPDAPPDLFKAMQEQLGLKLEPGKAPVEVFAVDHVEKPSAN